MAGNNAAPTLRGGVTVTVTTTATKVLEQHYSREFLGIANTGATAIMVGFSAALTTANGWPIAAGASFLPPVPPGDEIWLIASSGTPTAIVLAG